MSEQVRFTCKKQRTQDLLRAIDAIQPVVQLIRENRENTEYKEYVHYINTFTWINDEIVIGLLTEYEKSWSDDKFLAMLIILFNKNIRGIQRDITANRLYMKLRDDDEKRSKIPLKVYCDWNDLINYIKNN